MIRHVALVTAMSIVLVLGFGTLRLGVGATEATPEGDAPRMAEQAQPGMAEMMKMHEQMMAEMKASDAKLDALVKAMNAAAAGDAKINAVVAVVNELVGQHKAMHGRMGQMHEQMMSGRGMMMGR